MLAARLGHRVASFGEMGFTGRLPGPRDAAAAAEAMDSAQWHRLWTAARGAPLP